MKRQINPAPLVTEYSEYVRQMSLFDGQMPEIDLDIVDWHRRALKTVTIDQILQFLPIHSKLNFDIQMDDPSYTIERIIAQKIAQRIILNVETDKGMTKYLKLIKDNQIEVGISYNPENKAQDIAEFLPICDYVQFFTIEPGRQGAEFLPDRLSQAEELRKLGFKGLIGIDGGVNPSTIEQIKQHDINVCSVGSYICQAENPVLAYNNLQNLFSQN